MASTKVNHGSKAGNIYPALFVPVHPVPVGACPVSFITLNSTRVDKRRCLVTAAPMKAAQPKLSLNNDQHSPHLTQLPSTSTSSSLSSSSSISFPVPLTSAVTLLALVGILLACPDGHTFASDSATSVGEAAKTVTTQNYIPVLKLVLPPLLYTFNVMMFFRIPLTWYPQLKLNQLPWVIIVAPTEPLLKVTRKIITPIGGVDISPIVWFAIGSFLGEILLGSQGILNIMTSS